MILDAVPEPSFNDRGSSKKKKKKKKKKKYRPNSHNTSTICKLGCHNSMKIYALIHTK